MILKNGDLLNCKKEMASCDQPPASQETFLKQNSIKLQADMSLASFTLVYCALNIQPAQTLIIKRTHLLGLDSQQQHDFF